MLGFVAAVVVFAALSYFAGVDELVGRVTMAGSTYLIAVLAIMFVWLVAWGASLKTVLSVLGVNVSTARSFPVFMGATFSNNITPFGQVGDEPTMALLISRSTDTKYGTGPAAAASVDTINFVPSITTALIGTGYYTTEVTLSRNLETTLVAVTVLAVDVSVAVYTAWRCRYGPERRLIGALTSFTRTIARHVPRVSASTNDGIECRISGFFRSIERVGRNPWGLTVVLDLLGLGWFCQMVALWVVLHAIGAPIASSIVLPAVPIGAVAGVMPLPDGAGGIEWTLAILVAIAGSAASFDVATAGIVVLRGLVHRVSVVLGGLVMSTKSVRGQRS